MTLVRQVRRRLRHAPRVAQGANATAFAEIGDKVVMPAVVTLRLGKTVRQAAVFQIFAKRLAVKGFGRVMVVLRVELVCD